MGWMSQIITWCVLRLRMQGGWSTLQFQLIIKKGVLRMLSWRSTRHFLIYYILFSSIYLYCIIIVEWMSLEDTYSSATWWDSIYNYLFSTTTEPDTASLKKKRNNSAPNLQMKVFMLKTPLLIRLFLENNVNYKI